MQNFDVKGCIKEYPSTAESMITKDLQKLSYFLDQPVSNKQERMVLVEGPPGMVTPC